MPIRPSIATLVAAALAATPALADEFTKGVKAYADEDFRGARAIFLDLAELGDGASQYNLGAMALKGQGTPKDRGEAAGWMLAARENGYDPTPGALGKLVSALDAAGRDVAGPIVARFGATAMARTVLPSRYAPPAGMQAPSPLDWIPVRCPEDVLDGFECLVLAAVLAPDGRLRDPEIVLVKYSSPRVGRDGLASTSSRRVAAQAAVRERLAAVLHRRYEPARVGGEPLAVHLGLVAAGGYFREIALLPGPSLDTTLAAFERGALTRGRRLAASALDQDIVETAQGGDASAQLMVGTLLLRQGEASKALPWLERAARAGSGAARVRQGLALLERADAPLEQVRELLSGAGEAFDSWGARHAIEALACPNARGLRDPRAALEIARRARLDWDRDPLSQVALAAARASAGDRDGAARAQQGAIERAKKLGWDVGELERRLSAYAEGRPCEAPFLPRAAHFAAKADEAKP